MSDETEPTDPGPTPNRRKKIKMTLLVTVLPATLIVVQIAHELWQWVHGQ